MRDWKELSFVSKRAGPRRGGLPIAVLAIAFAGLLSPSSWAQLQDLTITKTHIGSFTQGDTGKSYTIAVKNSGELATSGMVTVTDTLPAALTATAMSGTGWTCTLGTLTCSRNDALAAGEIWPPIMLTANVASNAPFTVTNTATVSGGDEV